MNKGYIKLHRKSLDNGLLKNHKAWVLFSYCLLKATHKEFKAIVGNHEVLLYPGQLIFGRRRASEETGLTHQQIRTALQSLRNLKILTSKSTNKFSIITIINWDTYQSIEPENNQQINQSLTSKQPHTRTKEHKNNIPDFFSLKKRYSDPELIEQVFEAIASTRKSNRVAENVLIAQLQKWEKYPASQVEAGIRAYLDKNCTAEGKDEKYLLGIIRNQNSQSVSKPKSSNTPVWL